MNAALVAILKVSDTQIRKARVRCKFRFRVCPSRLSEGDLILLSELYHTRDENDEPIRFSMTYSSCKKRRKVKTDSARRAALIQGRNFRRLTTPFDINEVKVSNKKYSRCPRISYVQEVDMSELLRLRLLC